MEALFMNFSRSYLLKNWKKCIIFIIVPFLQVMATYKGHLQRSASQRPFILSRSVFAGSQRYGMCN